MCRDRDRLLQLLILNEEFLVNAGHQLALITSLPFVHTARRSYRLDDKVKVLDAGNISFFLSSLLLARNESNFPQKLPKPYFLEEGEVVTRFP